MFIVELLVSFLFGVFFGGYAIGRKINYDGKIVLEETEVGKLFTLELDSDPEDLESKKFVTFKVTPR